MPGAGGGYRRWGGFRVGKLFGKKHLKIFSPCPLLSASRVRSVAQRLRDPRRLGFKPLLVYHEPSIRTITTYPARPTVEHSRRLLHATTDIFYSFQPSCNTHIQNARTTSRTDSRSNGVWCIIFKRQSITNTFLTSNANHFTSLLSGNNVKLNTYHKYKCNLCFQK